MTENQHAVLPAPADQVSALRFGGEQFDHLLVSCWDGSVSLFDGQSGSFRSKYTHKAAVLDCCFGETDGVAYSGGLDTAVVRCDLESNEQATLGSLDDSHKGAVKCLVRSGNAGVVISGSWDKTVKLWDARSPTSCATHDAPDKVYAMAASGWRLVVGTAGRHVWIWDLRKMAAVQQRRESSLKYQTRCIAAYHDGNGYALGSIEGRVALEYFDVSTDAQSKKYAFKCHRAHNKKDGVDTVYPVNCLAFHPKFTTTFASGGCDGVVNLWDGGNKKRIAQHSYATSIASMSFNRDGSLLAVAASYTFEEGEKDHPADAVYIRSINDDDVMPRPKPAQPAA